MHGLSTGAGPQPAPGAGGQAVDNAVPGRVAGAPAGHRVTLTASWKRREVARAGRRPPAVAGAASVRIGASPASNTLRPKRGWMQGWRGVRSIRAAVVPSPVMGPTRARPRAGCALPAGTVQRAT